MLKKIFGAMSVIVLGISLYLLFSQDFIINGYVYWQLLFLCFVISLIFGITYSFLDKKSKGQTTKSILARLIKVIVMTLIILIVFWIELNSWKPL